jgi:hypothetical protein
MNPLTCFVRHDLDAFHVSHSGCGDTGVSELLSTPFCLWSTAIGHFNGKGCSRLRGSGEWVLNLDCLGSEHHCRLQIGRFIQHSLVVVIPIVDPELCALMQSASCGGVALSRADKVPESVCQTFVHGCTVDSPRYEYDGSRKKSSGRV